MFEGVKPYDTKHTQEYEIKINVSGIGWVKVKTKTQFIVNGMLEQAAAKIAAGEYEKCPPPKRGEMVIELCQNGQKNN